MTKAWWLKKNCPRNPLAIVDGVCLYNYLKFREKMKSIISGGYFANTFLRVVWLDGQHMLPSDWYQWYRMQIISAMFSLTDCVSSDSDPSCSFDLMTLRKFIIWNMRGGKKLSGGGGVKNFWWLEFINFGHYYFSFGSKLKSALISSFQWVISSNW